MIGKPQKWGFFSFGMKKAHILETIHEDNAERSR
jgi:hypothetical protein